MSIDSKIESIIGESRINRYDARGLSSLGGIEGIKNSFKKAETSVTSKEGSIPTEVTLGGSGFYFSREVSPDPINPNGSHYLGSKRDIITHHNDLMGNIQSFQVLPDNSVVYSGDNGIVRLRLKEDGVCETEIILQHKKHSDKIYCLQVLPDATIVYGSNDGTIRQAVPQENGEYKSEVIWQNNESPMVTLHVLPDRKIIFGSEDGSISQLLPKESGGYEEQPEKLTFGHEGRIRRIQALSNGKIMFGYHSFNQFIIKQLSPIEGGDFVEDEVCRVDRGLVEDFQVLDDESLLIVKENNIWRLLPQEDGSYKNKFVARPEIKNISAFQFLNGGEIIVGCGSGRYLGDGIPMNTMFEGIHIK